MGIFGISDIRMQPRQRTMDDEFLSFIIKENEITVLRPTSISFQSEDYETYATPIGPRFSHKEPDKKLELSARVEQVSFRDFIIRFADHPGAKELIKLLVFKHPELLI